MADPPTQLPTAADRNLLDCDVIIVGAGQAGMACAHRLALGPSDSSDRPLKVLVLEASDHVGGRTRNYDLGSGRRDVASDDAFELGGTWLSPSHTAALGLCRELGLEVFNASVPVDAAHDGAAAAEDVDDHDDEYPWWYWGAEYKPNDMKRMRKTILHLHPAVDENGVETPQKVAFNKASDLLNALDERTLAELDLVGDCIDEDVELALGRERGCCWESEDLGVRCRDLDALSTGSVFLQLPRCDQEERLMYPVLTTPDGRSILRNVIHNKNADEPDKVSYLYNLLSFGGCNSSGPDSQYRVRGGTQAIPLKIAELLNEARDTGSRDSEILLNSPVQSIQLLKQKRSGDVVVVPTANEHSGSRDSGGGGASNAEGCVVKVRTEDGREFTSRAVVLTGTPPAVGKIVFEPPWAVAQWELLGEKMPMGRSMKFAAVFRRGPWWRRLGLQGDILASGLPKELSVPLPSISERSEGSIAVEWEGVEESLERSPMFGYCFDTSPYSNEFGVLACFLEGAGHRYFSSLSEERRRDLMREFLRLTFEDVLRCDGDESLLHQENESLLHQETLPWEPDEYVVGDWGPDSPYIGGAYTSYFKPQVLSDRKYWKAYRTIEKLPNVFLAGADYHAGFGNGYIEGAIRSGQRIADLIACRRVDDNAR